MEGVATSRQVLVRVQLSVRPVRLRGPDDHGGRCGSNAALNIETVPAAEGDQVASLVFDAIGEIAVPPGGLQVADRTCVMHRDVSVALVSTHTHGWGECAALPEFVDDQVGDEPFFVDVTRSSRTTPPVRGPGAPCRDPR